MNQLKEKVNKLRLQKKPVMTVFVFSIIVTLICLTLYQSAQIKEQKEQLSQIIVLQTEIEKLKQKNDELKITIEDLQNQNNNLLKKKLNSGGANKKTAYLTFDDGPSENTQMILDILAENNVKATFFIVGRDNEYYRSLYQRMINEGHVIAPHSYSHKYDEIYSSYENFIEDQTKIINLILSVGAKNPYIMRFPGGSGNDLAKEYGNDSLMYQILKHYVSLGYKYFDWNVDSKDSIAQVVAAERIEKNVIEGALKLQTPVILMHDSPTKTTTPLALQKIITKLKEAGYIFDVLSVKVKPVVQRQIS